MHDNKMLATWMGENGYTSSSLAKELGLSYESVYKFVTGVRAVSSNFQLRFVARFGWDEAAKVFDTSLLRSLSAEPA